MQVAELVPEVASPQGFLVCKLQVLALGERFEHRQVARARLVQTSEHRAHGPDTALWRDDQLGPALARMSHLVLVRDGLECSHGRRPDRDDATAGRARGVHQPCCIWWDAVELLVGRLVVFEDCDPVVQDLWRELLAAVD